ncbi:MAG: protein kinase, partial [Prevotella sp.]|nr:protein kinase [Prevotella sp.]
ILRTSDGTYVITDFGISQRMRSTLRRNSTRQISNSTEIGGGSLPYMAPEMFSGMPEAVKATDIWALGVTLYEIVTGDLPFFGQGGGMQLHGAELPTINADVSNELKHLITSCMRKDAWARPTAQELFDHAKSILEGQNIPLPWTEPHKNNNGENKTAKHVERVSKKPRITGMSYSENKMAAILVWIMTFTSLGLSILFTILAHNCWHNPFTILALTEVVIFSGSLMLLRNSKVGFWFILSAQIIGTILCCCFIHTAELYDKILVAFMILATVAGLPIIRFILSKKYSDTSSWSRMNHRLSPVIIVIMFVLLAGASALSFQGNIQAHKHLEKYNTLCDDLSFHIGLYKDNLDKSDVEDFLNDLSKIKDMEDKYAPINSHFAQYNELRQYLETSIHQYASDAAEYADSLSKVKPQNNLEYAKVLSKALYFYCRSLAVYNDPEVRTRTNETHDRFNNVANKYAFLIPTDIKFDADGDSDTKLYADRIYNLGITLEYYGLDPIDDHDVRLSYKIYNNGRLLHDRYSSTYSFTFTHTVEGETDFEWYRFDKDDDLDPHSWTIHSFGILYGNDEVHTYERGKILVEIWCGNIKLISKSTTLY